MTEYPEKMCGRCYDDVDELFDPPCDHKPEKLVNVPMGMHHCPDCGAMVMAALPHPKVCKRCRDFNHPAFDGPSK